MGIFARPFIGDCPTLTKYDAYGPRSAAPVLYKVE
jgi:hypothetical protein